MHKYFSDDIEAKKYVQKSIACKRNRKMYKRCVMQVPKANNHSDKYGIVDDDTWEFVDTDANVKVGDVISYKTIIGRKNTVKKLNWKPG